MTTILLSSRDVTKDQSCRDCGRPLYRRYPEARWELQWGHTTAEYAAQCHYLRPTDRRWPTPHPLKAEIREVQP